MTNSSSLRVTGAIASIESFQGLLRDCLALLDDLGAEKSQSSVEVLFDFLGDQIDGLRDNLLNVGFVGPFSSGKSLLISALLGQLHANRTPQGLWTWESDLLPSDTPPTSSCVTVVRRGETRKVLARRGPSGALVEVDGAKESVRRLITNSDLEDASSPRTVEVQIFTPDLTIPGSFVDLPGTQSNRTEDDVALEVGLQMCDCFVYVVSSSETMNRTTISQIADLHKLTSTEGKPVYFVMTQVDLRLNLSSDGTPAWQTTKDENERELRRILPESLQAASMRPVLLPIATPSRAKCEYLLGIGETDPSAAYELQIGDPARLIDELQAFLAEVAEPQKLAVVQREVQRCQVAVLKILKSIEETFASPRRRLEDLISQCDARLAQLSESKSRAMGEINLMLDRRLQDCNVAHARQDLVRSLDGHISSILESRQRYDEKFAQRAEILIWEAALRWCSSSVSSPYCRYQLAEPALLRDVVDVLESSYNMVGLHWKSDVAPLQSLSRLDNVRGLAASRASARKSGGTPLAEAAQAGGAVAGVFGTIAIPILGGVSAAIPIALAVGAGVLGIHAIRAARERRARIGDRRSTLELFTQRVADSVLTQCSEVLLARQALIQDAVLAWSTQQSEGVIQERDAASLRLDGSAVRDAHIHRLEQVRFEVSNWRWSDQLR